MTEATLTPTVADRDKVILHYQWTEAGHAHTWFQVLTFKGERIIHMKDCGTSRRRAERLASHA